MRKVLFPTDLSGDPRSLLKVAVQHARNLGAELLIAHVEPASSAGFVPLLDEARPGGPRSERLRHLEAATPVGHGIPHRHFLLQGDPSQQIVALATREQVDLIVLCTHGRKGLSRLLRGSVSEEVVRFAPCPVYCFRAAEEPSPTPEAKQTPPGELVLQRLGAHADVAQARLEEDLLVMLSGEVAGLRLWFQRQLDTATALAQDAMLVRTAGELLEVGAEGARGHPALERLRHYMEAMGKSCDASDFFVLDPAGVWVAGRSDAALGHRLSPEQHPFLKEAWAGAPQVSPPIASPIPTLGPQRLADQRRPNIFVVAPLQQGRGPRGLIGFRLRSEELNRLLSTSGPYRSIESYVFDREGTMLSPSRFEDALDRLDLPSFPTDPGHLQLRDPGGNLLAGHRPVGPPSAWPLTKMAADAVGGRAGIDLEGYRDYRGVPVVGAWQWLAEREMGVAVEVDRAEALPSTERGPVG
ncbi:MAG: universal stress protein [Deltaproteobacteria bacterium]|nr:universal stress protein [Deltaproteobacteria bacterium]